MRLHRFITVCDLRQSSIPCNDPHLLHQWKNVLRLAVGDRIILCDGKGNEAECVMEEIGKSNVILRPSTVRSVDTEAAVHVTLYCAILKRENFEWVVQKTTELGVRRIVPLITDRTVKTGIRLDRLISIAREASEQSGRGVIPEISKPMEFDQALSETKQYAQNLFFHTSRTGKEDSDREATSQKPKAKRSIGLWIGPEGGWSDDEVTAATQANIRISSLGPRILRAETAAVAACVLLTLIDQFPARCPIRAI